MSTNITVSKSGSGLASVIIHTSTVVENWINNIEQYNKLRTRTRYNQGYQKFLLDFLNVSRNIEIRGMIALEQDGSTSATTLRTRLKNLFKAGGTVNILYLSETITGIMTGLEFREIPADASTARYFAVTFSILEGSVRGT